MRHIYIRGILALIWLVAAIISATSKNFELMVLVFHLCYVEERKEQGGKIR